jgi:hypothetical protein
MGTLSIQYLAFYVSDFDPLRQSTLQYPFYCSLPIKCDNSLDPKPADGKIPTLKGRRLSSVGENPVSRALISEVLGDTAVCRCVGEAFNRGAE